MSIGANCIDVFISADLYDMFTDIENLCKRQLSDFQNFRLRPEAEEYRTEYRDAYREAYKRTPDVDEKFNSPIPPIFRWSAVRVRLPVTLFLCYTKIPADHFC